MPLTTRRAGKRTRRTRIAEGDGEARPAASAVLEHALALGDNDAQGASLPRSGASSPRSGVSLPRSAVSRSWSPAPALGAKASPPSASGPRPAARFGQERLGYSRSTRGPRLSRIGAATVVDQVQGDGGPAGAAAAKLHFDAGPRPTWGSACPARTPKSRCAGGLRGPDRGARALSRALSLEQDASQRGCGRWARTVASGHCCSLKGGEDLRRADAVDGRGDGGSGRDAGRPASRSGRRLARFRGRNSCWLQQGQPSAPRAARRAPRAAPRPSKTSSKSSPMPSRPLRRNTLCRGAARTG